MYIRRAAEVDVRNIAMKLVHKLSRQVQLLVGHIRRDICIKPLQFTSSSSGRKSLIVRLRFNINMMLNNTNDIEDVVIGQKITLTACHYSVNMFPT